MADLFNDIKHSPVMPATAGLLNAGKCHKAPQAAVLQREAPFCFKDFLWYLVLGLNVSTLSGR